jgi:hypothetical protein
MSDITNTRAGQASLLVAAAIVVRPAVDAGGEPARRLDIDRRTT